MAGKLKGRFGIARIVVGLVLAVAPGVASAATGSLLAPCSGQTGAQPFAQFLDPITYVLAPNGGLESGSIGWTLKGAGVVSGNQPYLASGTRFLALPAGSSATSPPMCVALGDLVNPLLSGGSAQVSFRFTPLLGGDWRIDDVYVDPYMRG